jgi:hypothetical protein
MSLDLHPLLSEGFATFLALQSQRKSNAASQASKSSGKAVRVPIPPAVLFRVAGALWAGAVTGLLTLSDK